MTRRLPNRLSWLNATGSASQKTRKHFKNLGMIANLYKSCLFNWRASLCLKFVNMRRTFETQRYAMLTESTSIAQPSIKGNNIWISFIANSRKIVLQIVLWWANNPVNQFAWYWKCLLCTLVLKQGKRSFQTLNRKLPIILCALRV